MLLQNLSCIKIHLLRIDNKSHIILMLKLSLLKKTSEFKSIQIILTN